MKFNTVLTLPLLACTSYAQDGPIEFQRNLATQKEIECYKTIHTCAENDGGLGYCEAVKSLEIYLRQLLACHAFQDQCEQFSSYRIELGKYRSTVPHEMPCNDGRWAGCLDTCNSVNAGRSKLEVELDGECIAAMEKCSELSETSSADETLFLERFQSCESYNKIVQTQKLKTYECLLKEEVMSVCSVNSEYTKQFDKSQRYDQLEKCSTQYSSCKENCELVNTYVKNHKPWETVHTLNANAWTNYATVQSKSTVKTPCEAAIDQCGSFSVSVNGTSVCDKVESSKTSQLKSYVECLQQNQVREKCDTIDNAFIHLKAELNSFQLDCTDNACMSDCNQVNRWLDTILEAPTPKPSASDSSTPKPTEKSNSSGTEEPSSARLESSVSVLILFAASFLHVFAL